MLMKKVLIFLCLLLVTVSVAARDDYRYRKLTMSEGLASNTVRNIVQDDYGYLWFGTDNGLCRYDGHRIQTYRITTNIINQYVSSLVISGDILFVGTDEGVFSFSLKDSRFERLSADIMSTVTHLAIDHDQQLWVATANNGVYCHSMKTGQTRHYARAATNNHVDFIMADSENRIWTISNANPMSVQRLNRLHDAFEAVALQSDVPYNGLCMLESRDRHIYLGTWTNGLMQMHADGSLKQVINPQLTGEGFHIHTLFQFADDQIYIGCDDGLLCYNPITGETVNMFRKQGISDRFVYSIATDKERGLWVGTFYGGVNYFSPVGDRFMSYTKQDGLSGNVISRFCEDGEGTVWMASDDGGLMRFLPAEKRFVSYPHQKELSALNVHALALKGNQLWIGTYSSSVYVLNIATGQLRHYGHDGKPNSISDYSSYAIHHDSHGRTWIGGMRVFTLYRQDTDDFEKVIDINSIIIDIDEDADGSLWMSTQGEGLWHYSPDIHQQKVYHHSADDPHSLPDDQVNCALIDATGRLWVGTMNGLCYYDVTHDSFEIVELDDQPVNVMGIVEQSGSLWLSTEHGLLRYEPKETKLAVHHFTLGDGLVSEQFIQNSCMKASDDRLYFGATNGFNTFYPYNIKVNNSETPVYITSLEVLNRQERTVEGYPLDLSFISNIDFDYADARMLSFSFVSLSYCSPGKNHYAYKLEGFDSEWNYVGTQHKATYTNLPAGTYTLRVKATNNDGVWSSKEAQLKITVYPPLWWSWWARLLYLLIIAALIWYYVHMRLLRAENRHQRELQRVREQNENESREARLNYFTMIAHEIRTPVSLIIAPLEKLKNNLSTSIQGSDNSLSQLDIIDRNAHRLLDLVNQLLDFRKVEQQSLIMHFASHNVSSLIHSVSERFEPTFEQGGKQFTTVYPPERLSAIIDRESIIKVISNLLTNANKYSKSKVELRCTIDPDETHFRIEVTDDGIGIRPEDRQRIFAPFYQAEGNKPGTGIGLSIVKRIVDLHHGTIDVDSELGKGSTFRIMLPVQQEEVNLTEEKGVNTLPIGDTEASSVNTANDAALQSADDGQTDKESASATSYMLIVDDNEDMVKFLYDHFSHYYRVLTALDGVEALSLLSKHEISIIVSDWMMPRMDGQELCRRVRLNPLTSHIPFLMLTAKTDNKSKIEGMNIGADVYIEKPFSVEYLEACIANILLMRRRLMQKVSSEPLEGLAQIGTTQVDSELLTKMNEIIEENVANANLNVNFLAEQLGISRSGLFAKIKSLTDITPNEMITVVRLKRAAILLQEGKYLVSEVGYMVGFSSPSYFSKCFQKQFGVKPGDYVKKSSLA